MVSSIQYINGFSMFAMVPESGVLDFTSDTKCFLIAVTDDKAGECGRCFYNQCAGGQPMPFTYPPSAEAGS